ncbi:GAF domain-containing sensor histidine kinase [Halobacillus sp. A1]|uniref:GAF domain-containing sensor histidine kinase n=1 Tax=Halobacillus sp. A1 TaxID=2880262 RepID=UPI0020A648EA|nr:GAF domain-containing sensor histidine kinase [Halobacillus sp. A1]MCP3031588.1 GAF domain-containing sensor histidine kinase [Halobacillus sp. A1]
MERYESMEKMQILKVIAETLNGSNDLKDMLQTVLEKLLELTRLETGWIFLVDEKPNYTFVADHRLPPALIINDKAPMCGGDCSCLNRYWSGRLKEPINIIECKRIENAIKYDWGDTNRMTHHATIPLADGEERFGILNVASPDKEHFTEEELTLLQSLSFQIGTAVKRTRLYEEQQRRAVKYEKLNELVRLIWKSQNVERLADQVVHKTSEIFQWKTVGLYLQEGESLFLKSFVDEDSSFNESVSLSLLEDHPITRAFQYQEVVQSARASREEYVCLPIYIKDEKLGVLYLAAPDSHRLSDGDVEVLQALTRHISLVYETLRLQEKRGELLLYEERKRLARDLHDSVNQKLFSLSLTARGAKEIISPHDQPLRDLLDEMLGMSQESLKEMRSLIWQLRPIGIEEGLVSAIKKYGEHLGLSIAFKVDSAPNWPRPVEETLWRISQEALNNVNKHSNTKEVTLFLYESSEGAGMEIVDRGDGFELQNKRTRSLGLTSMKERAELIGGILDVNSERGAGTTVHVFLPCEEQEKSGKQ